MSTGLGDRLIFFSTFSEHLKYRWVNGLQMEEGMVPGGGNIWGRARVPVTTK